MNGLIETGWAMYGPSLLMLLGAVMVLVSTRYVVAAVRAFDPQRALWIMRGFRIAVVGLACLGVGAGWRWQISGLVGLSLIIGGEELLESTVVIQALKDGLRRASGAGAAPAAAMR